jgi:polyhydroxyalkanoate synthesis regulator phasin
MKLKSPLKLLFLKPFKNKIIASKIEDLKEQINLETPEGREKRLRYVKEMLKQYKSYDERYPKIERDLERSIRDLMKPTNPGIITSLKKNIKSLEERL